MIEQKTGLQTDQITSRPAGMKKLIAVFVISLLVSVLPKTHAADFWDIYQLALQNDASYRSAGFQFESSKLALPLSQVQFRPSLTAGGTLGKQRSDASGDTVTGDSNAVNLNFGLPLYNRSNRIEIKKAELSVAAAEVNYANARDDLTLRVAERYFNILAAIDAQEVARLEKIAIKRQMDLAAERLDVGLGTRTDLFDAQARFQQAEADVIAAQVVINNATQSLKQIIGQSPEALAGLKDDAPLDLPEPNDLEQWISMSNSENLLLQAEQLNLFIAAQEIEKQRFTKSPTVDLNANQRWSESPSSFNTSSNSTSSITLDLNLPLYLGGLTKLRTRQAGYDYNSAEEVLEARRRQVSSDTTSAFLEVTSGISQVKALAEAIRAGQSALEAKEEGFSAGLTTNLDVLDAQRDLSRSRTDYLRARYNYILSILRLSRSAGQLNEDVIQRVNSWLDADNKSNKLSHSNGVIDPMQNILFDLDFRAGLSLDS